jgi:hypothetical protein
MEEMSISIQVNLCLTFTAPCAFSVITLKSRLGVKTDFKTLRRQTQWPDHH